ncbi:MAG: hypothetical protein B5M52_02835 [Helicobacteraceae bacterium 4484_230]|nr:MAG: hypothetical protein B5M52_02835 [Helicobacteraceae bacterium 4484_230]
MKRKLKWFWLVMMGLSVQLYALTPSTPTVSASDGTYPDKVHVSISGGGILKAPSYEIYRNNISSCAAENGCRMIYKDGTSSYDDTDVKRDTTYYYWARVCDGTSCSDYSSYNTGYAHLDKPPKTSIDASDGTYTDKVELTIKPQSEATSYKIYRSIKNSLPTAEYKTVTATSYNDTSVKAGTTYYYWVKKIVVKINSVSGATEYRLYRSEKDTLPSNVYATTTSTQYKDTSVTQGTTYYYWVKACNSGGCKQK